MCCEVLNITALGKPACVKCEWQRDGSGCAIYGQHPDVCRDFKCLWHAGDYMVLQPLDKPDDIGIMFTYDPEIDEKAVCGHVRNLEDAHKGRARLAIRRFLKKGMRVIVMCSKFGTSEVKIFEKKGDI